MVWLAFCSSFWQVFWEAKVVSILSVTDHDEIMLMSQNGIAIRMPTKDISVIGRNTLGVRVMKLTGSDKLVAAANIINEEG